MADVNSLFEEYLSAGVSALDNKKAQVAAAATQKKGYIGGAAADVGLAPETTGADLLGMTDVNAAVSEASGRSDYMSDASHQRTAGQRVGDSAIDIVNGALQGALGIGAVQLTEAVLQKDLLAAAGVIVYAGAATTNGTITGEGATPSKVDYADLMRLDQTLTDNRTPKQTKVITGSRLVDTKTLPSARVLYVGSELVPLLKGMVDLFSNQAFIPVQQYGDAGTILNGEIGTIDAFRIIEVPEMLNWAGVGAAATGANLGYRFTAAKYDVFPMLCIGSDSFSTIGFQTDGKTVKFSVLTKMPGKETADRNDPYGETGFSSIKWYYGILIKRPERIGLIKTVAPL